MITSTIDLSCIKEYTIECNPGDINFKFIDKLSHINCNRISLGIQSFDNQVLMTCNRNYQTYHVITNSLSLINRNNYNLSIDLINGLPGLDINHELHCLDQILKTYLNINHLSFYELGIEKSCFFYNQEGSEFPDDKIIKKYLKEFNQLIKTHNFKQYEISNYMRNNCYSKHNVNYWKYKNYLGIGPAAHSHINSLRIENLPDIEKYNRQTAFYDQYHLTLAEQIEEYLLMGLRLVDGIAFSDFYDYFHYHLTDIFVLSINKYLKQKLISISNHRIHLTKRGLNWLNTILVNFFIELENYFKKQP